MSQNENKESLAKRYLKPSKQTVINWLIGTTVMLGLLYWINGGTKVNGHSFVKNNDKTYTIKDDSNLGTKTKKSQSSDNPFVD